MVKVLHLIWRLDKGGIESFCLGLLDYIDNNTISFDFVVCGDKIGENEQLVRELGCSVYHLPLIQGKRGKKAYLKELYCLLKEEKYDIVHSHLAFMNLSTLSVARRLGVSGRISHVHIAAEDIVTWNRKFKLVLQQFLMRFNATNCFGCSEATVLYYFGKLNKKVKVLYSGVDTCKFMKGNKNNNDGNIIVVARMAVEKNPLFILEIMKELLLINPEYSFTWCGDGELFDLISARSKDIKDHLSLVGGVNNIKDYLQQSSYMLMPSIKEGMGMAAIEAQLADVFVFASDKIPVDTDLGLIKYISLKKSAKEWAYYINRFIVKENSSSYHLNRERIKEFDIKIISKEMEGIYQRLARCQLSKYRIRRQLSMTNKKEYLKGNFKDENYRFKR